MTTTSADMMVGFLWLMLAAFLVLAPDSADARTRDSVKSGAYRCASISDSRQWLDCYYGAAQSIRDALGLPPALPSQVALATSPPAGEARDIGIRDEVISDAAKCVGLAGDRKWLDCYYSAAQPMRSYLGLQSAPQVSLSINNDAPAIPKTLNAENLRLNKNVSNDFGLRNSSSTPSKEIDRVVSRMSSYSFDQQNIFTVTLANGQAWRQVSGDTDNARWRNPPDTYLVTIRRGFLGSFNLEVRNNVGVFKVKRLK
jgi:hypothetical protein